MFVREIMSPNVECVSPGMSLADAAKLMKTRDIGCLLIEGAEGGKLIGIVTDRDITCRAIAEGANPVTTTIGEIMTKNAVYCFDDQDVEDVAQLMEAKKVHRLPVMDHYEHMIGLVSLTDLARHTSQELSGQVLKAVSKYSH